jgi:ribose 5-phosphate isomerase A
MSGLESIKDSTNLDALARHALRYVKTGQTIGLGTGRAASAFIRAVAEAKLGIRGVPTSNASEQLARSLGIEVVDLREAPRIDADFDGADEVDPSLNMIKGLGGAMVREKIVAAASKTRVFLVTEEKLVRRLGARGNLPVEVIPCASSYVSREIAKLGLKPAVRKAAGAEYVSDNGNSVLDCAVEKISNPARLERSLLAIPGVVGTGLFIAMANVVLVMMNTGRIKTLRRTNVKAG